MIERKGSEPPICTNAASSASKATGPRWGSYNSGIVPKNLASPSDISGLRVRDRGNQHQSCKGGDRVQVRVIHGNPIPTSILPWREEVICCERFRCFSTFPPLQGQSQGGDGVIVARSHRECCRIHNTARSH